MNKSHVLIVVFFLAMLMGAGPGLFLINGKGPFLGLPVVYAWGVFWFLVQGSVILTAYFTVWDKQD